MSKQKSALRQTITEQALNMFKTHGIKAVRMDDVAKELKISKRTLYEQFVDKEQLLLECVMLNSDNSKKIYEDFMSKTDNLMEILCFFIKYRLEEFSRYNSLFFMEVIKYKPVRDYLEDISKSRVKEQENFIKRGIEEGLVVDNINFKLLSRINKAAIDNLIRDKVYEQYPLSDIFRTFMMVFLRGILTEKGQVEFEKYIVSNLK
ncbi:MAG: TetR/AcrR family transcriptional regulator [Bacteroidaceae bacterium]|nr:TetR/AcrR family transcriptional regulator [Bacteroidaceae bacterium]